MQGILARVRTFFTGLRLVILLMPRFVWMAFRKAIDSIIKYWKESQSAVHEITDYYTDEAIRNGITTEYDSTVFWVCFSIASFLYLVGLYVNAWLLVQGLHWLVSALF